MQTLIPSLAPLSARVSCLTCLFPYCESTFHNEEDLDLHYKLVHRTLLGFEGAPLANTIVSTAEEPSQSLSSFRPDVNLVQNDSHAIKTSLHGPSVGHVEYDDLAMDEQNAGLLTQDASSRDTFEMHQSSSSLSLVDDFSFINNPHAHASSVVGGYHPNNSALLSFVPIEAASTIVNLPALLPTSISPPAPPPQGPTTGVRPTRHVCATCRKTFSRPSDMRRHALKYNSSAQRYDCQFPGCRARGFLRTDKLMDHVRNMHQ